MLLVLLSVLVVIVVVVAMVPALVLLLVFFCGWLQQEIEERSTSKNMRADNGDRPVQSLL